MIQTNETIMRLDGSHGLFGEGQVPREDISYTGFIRNLSVIGRTYCTQSSDSIAMA